jgi:hypothetical protein
MIFFGESFLTILVYGALAVTSGGCLVLWTLLIRDWRARRLW